MCVNRGQTDHDPCDRLLCQLMSTVLRQTDMSYRHV